MEINSASVDAYQKILANPAAYSLPFRPILEAFEKSDTVTPKHILANQYMEEAGAGLPKIFCYIVMDNVFGICNGKAESGELGYYLKYKPRLEEPGTEKS